MSQPDLETLVSIARDAGDQIMQVYNDASQFEQVDFKADDSPLTLADRRAHDVIDRCLRESFPDIPVLSEEGASIEYDRRRHWGRFWLVDPLDGTKEFIHRNGEFTVNIALVVDGTPVMGVVHAPALGRTYIGSDGLGAFLATGGGEFTPIGVGHKADKRIAVRSKSHASPEEEIVLERFDVVDCVSVGSSLKFCYVADGTADVYYRHGPTMEWDVAAGQAVVRAAGGDVFSGVGTERFRLNKENLLNGSFLCLGFDRDGN